MSAYTIGELARHAGVGVETVRYYQRRGLLAEPLRQPGHYRTYGAETLARLTAIRRAQTLGFSLEEIGALLALNEQTDRARARALAQGKIDLIDARIGQLQAMRTALTELVDCCRDASAEAPCPILRALTADQTSQTTPPHRAAPSDGA